MHDEMKYNQHFIRPVPRAHSLRHLCFFSVTLFSHQIIRLTRHASFHGRTHTSMSHTPTPQRSESYMMHQSMTSVLKGLTRCGFQDIRKIPTTSPIISFPGSDLYTRHQLCVRYQDRSHTLTKVTVVVAIKQEIMANFLYRAELPSPYTNTFDKGEVERHFSARMIEANASIKDILTAPSAMRETRYQGIDYIQI
jgi:hypothetical protein